VVPIPKVHPPTSIENDLRPISLLPTLAKILEGIIKDWLMPILEPSLDQGQFGCHPGRSTTHALIAIQHKWLTALEDGGSVRALFVDFRKAFDLVDQNILITKLNKFNIPNCLLQWFQSYLSHRSQRVRINRSVSSWQSLNGSMPQGSCLGPLSFTVMIDDLHSPCELHKFVDDTTLSELVTSSCSVSNMPSYFASLLSWTEDNNMQINISKTKEMVLGCLNIDNLPLLSTSLGSVEHVTSFKLLGINLDAKLSWSLHINIISAKASKRLYFLNSSREQGFPQINSCISMLQQSALFWSTVPLSGSMPSPVHIQKRAIHIMYRTCTLVDCLTLMSSLQLN